MAKKKKETMYVQDPQKGQKPKTDRWSMLTTALSVVPVSTVPIVMGTAKVLRHKEDHDRRKKQAELEKSRRGKANINPSIGPRKK